MTVRPADIFLYDGQTPVLLHDFHYFGRSFYMMVVQILIDIRIIGFQYFFDIDCPACSMLYKRNAVLRIEYGNFLVAGQYICICCCH